MDDLIHRFVRMPIHNHIHVVELGEHSFLETSGRTPPMNETEPEPTDFHYLFFRQHGLDGHRVHVSAHAVEIFRAEKIDDHRRGVVSHVEEHFHLSEVTIQHVSEILAHPVNVRVGEDADSHGYVPIFVQSSAKYIRMGKKDKP